MTARHIFHFFQKNKDIIASAFIFVLTFFIYTRTLLPAVGTGDTAKFQFITSVMGIPHTTGYPIYLLTGKLFSFLPIGSLAYRINLMSAFFASLTGVALYFVSLRIVKNLFISLLTAVVFCFSLTFWSQAVIAEVYTLNIFFISVILLFLLIFKDTKRPVYIFFAMIFLALALGNHLLIITVIPSVLAAILLIDPRFFRSIKNIAFTILPFVLTISSYMYLYFRALSHPVYNEGNIDSFPSLIWYLTGGIFKGHFFRFGIDGFFDRTIVYLNILFNQFTVPVLVLGIAGMILMMIKKTRIFIVLFLTLLMDLLIIANYDIFDIDVYIIPSAFVFSIFFGYSIFSISAWAGKRASRLKEHSSWCFNIMVAAAMIIISVSSLFNILQNYNINDRSGELDNYLRAKNIISKVEDNAVIIPEDYFVSMSLLYYSLVEYREKNIIIPFSFISNPYYIDLVLLEEELGLKREPFRMSLDEIGIFKKEHNIFMEDFSAILQKRPVYILQTNPIIAGKLVLEEITKQRYSFKELLVNIPQENNIIILLRDVGPDQKKRIGNSLEDIGFKDLDIPDTETDHLAIITDKDKIFAVKGLREEDKNDLDALAEDAGISLSLKAAVQLKDYFLLEVDRHGYLIRSPIVVLNMDNNFNKFYIYEFDDLEDSIMIPYSYSNPQIFKVLSVR